MDKEFRCRTKTISGTNYSVTILRDGKPQGYASCGDSMESAERLAEKFREIPGIETKIEKSHWSRKVCIECGNEVF